MDGIEQIKHDIQQAMASHVSFQVGVFALTALLLASAVFFLVVRFVLQPLRRLHLGLDRFIAVLQRRQDRIAYEINTPLGAIQSSGDNITCFLECVLTGLPELHPLLSAEEDARSLKICARRASRRPFWQAGRRASAPDPAAGC